MNKKITLLLKKQEGRIIPFLFLLYCFCMPFLGYSQASIFYTNDTGFALPNEDVQACLDRDDMPNQARILFTNDAADNASITIQMPTGISYRAGTINVVNQQGGLSIVEADISDLSAPVFNIMPADLSANNEITIEWARFASCDAVDFQMMSGIFKDAITLDTDAGQVVEDDLTVNTYDLLVPSLSMFSQGAITTALGSTVTRDITITNGGLGDLENFTFYIKDGTGTATTQLATADGTVIMPSSINVDTLFYTLDATAISEVGNMDNLYENGEQIVLTRTYDVIACDNDSYYQAYWGCGSVCQATSVLLQETIMPNLVPNLQLSMPNIDYDYCFNGDDAMIGGTALMQQVRVENTGSGAATDFELEMFSRWPGSGSGRNYFSNELWTITNDMGNVIGTMSDFESIETQDQVQADCSVVSAYRRVRQKATGITIQPGEVIYINIPTYGSNIDGCSSCSGDVGGWVYFSGEWEYKDPCMTSNYANPLKFFGSKAHNFARYSTEMPTDLVDGQEFKLNVAYSTIHTRVRSGTEGYVQLVLDLTGTSIEYNGGPTLPWAGYTLNISTSPDGDSIFVDMPENIATGGDLDIPLRASCAGAVGGTQVIDLMHFTKYRESCMGEPFKYACLSSPFTMHCPGPCPEGGATPITFSLERTTLGLPDNDNNGVPDPTGTLNMDTIRLHRAMNGDTVKGTWELNVYPNTVGPNAGVPFNHTYIEFDLGTNTGDCGATNQIPFQSTAFTALPDAEVTIYPASGAASFTCLVTPVVTGSIAKYDLTPCKATWEGGDSIHVEALYTANASIQRTGFIQYVASNEVYSSYVPNPTGANPSAENKYTCDHFDDYMNIYNLYPSLWYPYDQRIDGCSGAINIYGRMYINTQAGAVWFPFEYRNFAIVDQFIVNWPDELPYRPGSATFNGQAIDDANITQAGGQLTFSNIKDFYTPYGGSFTPPDEVFSTHVRWQVDPSCDAVAGIPYRSTFKTQTIGNGVNTPVSDWDSFSGCTRDSSNTANITYSEPQPFLTGGGQVQFTTEEVCWNVNLNNGSNSIDADNSWFFLEDVNNSLSNFSVMQGANVINEVNGFYQLGVNANSSSMSYTICADAMTCDTAKLNVISSFHCSSYPNAQADIVCADTVALVGVPLESEVQLEVVNEPVPPISLCSMQNIAVKLSSAQAAYLDDPVLDIIMPAGANVVGNIMVEYGENSGNIEALTPTLMGNTLRLNLEDHSMMGSGGIPGTIDALTPEERAVVIRFSFDTNCDFASGGNFEFQAFAMQSCGATAINNGVRVRTADLTIVGVNNPFAATIQMAMDNAPELIGCTSTEVQVEFELVALDRNMTAAQDSVFVTLAEGVDFVPASFNCCSADAANCLTFAYSQTLPSGQTKLALAFPVIDLSTPQDFCFTYDVTNSAESECNVLKSIDVAVVGSVTGVACVSEPGGACPSLAVVAGQEDIDFTTRKTALSLLSSNFECVTDNAMIEYTAEFMLDELALEAGQRLYIDFYCVDAAGMPDTFIGVEVVEGPIAIGSTFMINNTTNAISCDLSNGVIMQVSKTASNAQNNCLCEEISVSSTGLVCPPPCPPTRCGTINAVKN